MLQDCLTVTIVAILPHWATVMLQESNFIGCSMERGWADKLLYLCLVFTSYHIYMYYINIQIYNTFLDEYMYIVITRGLFSIGQDFLPFHNNLLKIFRLKRKKY